MSERFRTDRFDDQPLEFVERSVLVEKNPPFPAWLAARFLRPDEKITWVRRPRFTPSWSFTSRIQGCCSPPWSLGLCVC